jgi:hypothetical protein
MGSVVVVRGDQILLNKGYGMANLEWNIPNAPDVNFRLSSLTKQFTAALVLLIQQGGKLRTLNRTIILNLQITDTLAPSAPTAANHARMFQLLRLTIICKEPKPFF